ncbi:PH domain-containing protein [Streptomyces formicae]|uniref:PH domain-containing protein n=1 Tax=Streptomyces formicae TaxID=1616117 RepID=A0ABY3WHI9_9ACTN|nr:PH domain-containing protein [Streptomyces formicae]UNM10929.1 PH domain-containing protein [Streptomyces formicae]
MTSPTPGQDPEQQRPRAKSQRQPQPPSPSQPRSQSRSESSAEPSSADRVFRSSAGIATGVLLLALVAWVGGDALIRGEGRAPWLGLAAMLFVVPLIVAFTLRPAVFAGDDRLRVRNPFRTVTLPWAAVADVRAGYSSEVFTQKGVKYQLWAIPVSLRQRKRAARRQATAAQDDPHGRTSVTASLDDASRLAPADRTVADLRALAERSASRPGAQGEPRVQWAYEILAPIAAGLVFLVVLLATR